MPEQVVTDRRVGGLLASYIHRQMVGGPTMEPSPMMEDRALREYLGEVQVSGAHSPGGVWDDEQKRVAAHELIVWLRVGGELVDRRVTVRVEVE